MLRNVVSFLATGFAILILDMIWLRIAGAAIFRPEVGPLLREDPNLIAASLFYILYVAGLVYFAVAPAARDGGVALAVTNGAILGIIAYMTFELTSLALIKGWSTKVAIADIGWGAFVSAVSAAVGYYGTVFFFPSR